MIYPKANIDIKILIASSEIYMRWKNESPYFNDFSFILQKIKDALKYFSKLTNDLLSFFRYVFEKVREQEGQDEIEIMRSRLKAENPYEMEMNQQGINCRSQS